MDVSIGVMIGPYRPIQISRENNIIQTDLPGDSPDSLIYFYFIFYKIDQMDSTIGFEIDHCRGNTWTMCKFHDSYGNGFRDIWWTDKLFYFSSIDSVYNLYNSPEICSK